MIQGKTFSSNGSASGSSPGADVTWGQIGNMLDLQGTPDLGEDCDLGVEWVVGVRKPWNFYATDVSATLEFLFHKIISE